MQPYEINAAIKKAGASQTAIAKALNVHTSAISGVVHGSYHSSLIKQTIVDLTGIAASKLWPHHVSREEKKARAIACARAAMSKSQAAA